MCTVTLVITETGAILTSNRDEQTIRPPSVQPEITLVGSKKLLFPKDPRGGGSWFVADDMANVGVLLNGGREKHALGGKYRMSRGLILTTLLSAADPLSRWHQISLSEIEPFTIVLIQSQKYYQLIWDGQSKDTGELSPHQHYIWSSVTLYDEETRENRVRWFNDFMTNENHPDPERLRKFHSTCGEDDPLNGLVINRHDVVKTQSITQAVIDRNKLSMYHMDLMKNTTHRNAILIV